MERLIGKQAPYFSMEALSADGEHFVRVALPDYAGKWLVLFFYPMDFTFVCPTELTAFSEHREAFRAAGAELLSVSTDSVYTHQAWQRNGLGGLGYPMAADQTLRVCADYGVLLEEEGVALRGLFLIDPEQKVRYSVIHDNNIGRNPEEVLRVLAALKTGGLCAAGWKAGEENLRPDMAEREAPVLAGTAPVRIYTMPGCSYCRSVKEFLRQGGIDLSCKIEDLEPDADVPLWTYKVLVERADGREELHTFYLMNQADRSRVRKPAALRAARNSGLTCNRARATP